MKKLNLNLIKNQRKINKLSQEDVAKKLGFNTLYPYHRRESGQQPFTAQELYVLSKLYGVNIEYFFEELVAKNATDENSYPA
ncbi:helix-turn-helix domain-containing protein [Metabacillus sp. HB246100]